MNKNTESNPPSEREEAEKEEPPLSHSPVVPRPTSLTIQGRNRSSQKTFWRTVDSQGIGLKNFGMDPMDHATRNQLQQQYDDASGQQPTASSIPADRYVYVDSVEYKESEVRRKAIKNPYLLFFLGTLAAMKVLIFYLSALHSKKCVTSTRLRLTSFRTPQSQLKRYYPAVSPSA
jgi:hypothetical protein